MMSFYAINDIQYTKKYILYTVHALCHQQKQW